MAREFKRFNNEETETLDNQISVYLSLSEVPQFNFTDRVDDWWIKTLSVIGDQSGEYPHILKRLVVSALTLSHGQGFIERGFNTSKWILKGNCGSLTLESFVSQKRMKDMCEK